MTHRIRISTRVMSLPILAVIMMISSVQAAPVRVIKNDGNEIKGDLVSENKDKIVLSISGIKAEIFKSTIKQIIREETVGIWFKNKMSTIKPDDLDAKFDVAQELLKKESKAAVELAIKLCKEEIEKNDDRRFELLKQLADEQLKKYGRTPKSTNKSTYVTSKRDDGTKVNRDKYKLKKPVAGKTEIVKKFDPRVERKDGDVPTDKQVLPQADINRIKIFELDTRSRVKPIVSISKETREKFFNMFPEDQEVPSTAVQKRKFANQPPLKQLIAIMEYGNRGTRDLYSEIQIRNDPPVMLAFKQKIQRTVVLNYCGNCHTKSKGGSDKFFLFGKSPSKESIAYTNFLIMDQYENEQGLMIDRDRPTESLLLRYGLPGELAGGSPHPEVNYLQPLFRSTSDKLYLSTLNWIRSLYNPSEYGITFTSPLYKPVVKEQAEKAEGTTEAQASAE